MDLTRLRQMVAELTPAQRARLEERLLAIRAPGEGAARIPRRDRTRPCPLSLAQQRLWFLDQLQPGSPVYNEPTAFRLEGPLDVDALGRALTEIVARHEAIRTVFRIHDGKPCQIVQPARPLPVDLVDLSCLDPSERESALARVLADGARRAFDLTADLMLRVRLVRLASNAHVLVLVKHHIASDGWSAGVLERELGTLYDAFARGAPSPLPALAIQYGDFAVWQREWLEGGELDRQLEYWRRQLAGAPPALELPADHPRPGVSSYRGARVVRMMPASLAARLRNLGRSESATMFMVLVAGFCAVLQRYTGRDDLMVGSPIAGRTRVEVEPLIGFFVGTLPLRVDLTGDPAVRELVRRVRETALGAYTNQEAPFEKLVEELGQERTLSRNPLVQVLLVLQDGRRGRLEMSGLQVRREPVSTDTAKLDLSLHVTESPDGLEVVAIHSTELFESARIARLLGHFETVLAAMAGGPDEPLSALPLLTEAERQQSLVEWNRTDRVHGREPTLHRLIEVQVARSPESVAIVWRGERLTYGALNTAANRLAHHLRALGVRPEMPVAVCLPRSPALVVALLAVLKAGGAYVPLDAEHPAERLRLILADAAAPMVLTEAALVARLGPGSWTAVCVDRDAGQWAGQPGADLAPVGGPDSLAYVAYTSGSTGRPKGILCTHGSAVNYLAFVLGEYGLGPADVVLPRSSVAFDASVRELFGTLAAGARMVLLEEEQTRDPNALVAGACANDVTVLTLVPSLLRTLTAVAETAKAGIPSLRLVLVAGEPLFATDVRRARIRLAPSADFVNQYGPTECTIISTFHRARADEDAPEAVPIGRPVWNATIYVLDGHRRPVPVGVPGELYIGGVGVARGYLGSPALTSERFLPDPFSSRPGARMYRTGDVARHRPDGTLEILGRTDNQVKVRGNRVEPEEIESVIRQCPAVREVAVGIWPLGAVDAELVAYLVPDTPGEITPGDVRSQVRAHLPAYMVPRYVEIMPRLPLTPIGKIDRRALPAPSRWSESVGVHVEPRSLIEWQIAQIWERLLGLPRVGATDSFFDLGGHSLLAVRMMHEIEHAYGRRLPLTVLFQAPTVEGLAAALARGGGANVGGLLTPIRSEGTRPPFFYLHGDPNGGGLHCHELGRGLALEQPFYAVHPHPLVDRPLPPSVEAMATDYIREIRRVQPLGPYRLGGHCNGGLIAYEMARQLVAAGEGVDVLVLLDATPRNARFLALRRVAASVARWRGLGPVDEARLFVRLRQRVIALGEYAAASARWLRRHRRAAALARCLRRPCRPVGQGGLGDVLDEAPPMPSWREPPRVDEYRWLIRGYVPRGYPGRLVALVPEEERLRRRPDGWARVAGEVEVHLVPGAHLTVVTRHAAAVAAQIEACLRRADHRPAGKGDG